MDRSEASALADLQMHWDEAYVIGLDGDVWKARFRNSTDELRAHSSTELRELIRTDYTYRRRARPIGQQANPSSQQTDPESEQAGPEQPKYAGIRGERMST